jgi:integrase
MDDGDAADLRAQIAALTSAIQALTGATARADPGVTFADVAERYGRRVGRKCMYTLVPFLRHFGDRTVASSRKVDLLHWRDEIRAVEVTCFKRPPSVGTLNQELLQAQAMMRWAVANEVIDANPFEGIVKLKGQRPRETGIDPAEDEQAFAGAPLLVRAFQAVCADTGARNGCEVRLLERRHVDRATSLLRFPRANTKGQVMTRDVPISAHTLALLDELPAVVGTVYVFANPRTKRPYSRVHLTRLCRPYLDRLTPAPGDGRVVTHDRRHTRVSRMARDGMNPMASMKLIGHKTPAMHWRYLHVSDADRARMKAALDRERH